LDGNDCYIVESSPKETEAYKRATSWIRKDVFLPVQVLFFQDSKEESKRLLFKNIIEAGALSFPTEWIMEDVANKTRTLLNYDNLNFRAEISDHLFTAHAVEQGIR
jgi:outer membrane lipoprotein-sorting protein